MADDGATVKSRWRSILNKKKEEQAEEKVRANNDVMDFLAPSIAASQERQDSIKPAASAAAPLKFPKIDVAAAQRFPEAHDYGAGSPNLQSAGGLSSSLKGSAGAFGNRRKKKGLRVTFAKGPPEVIGEGGDESEVAPMELGKPKETKPSGINRFSSMFKSSQRNAAPKDNNGGLDHHGLKRTQTGVRHGSRDDSALPSLQQQGDDDFQPSGLRRVATEGPGAANSNGQDAPGVDDDDDFTFKPKRLTRTATGFSSIYDKYGDDDDNKRESLDGADPFGDQNASNADTPYSAVPDRAPTLPEIDLLASESPLDYKEYRNSMSGTYSEASPKDPTSFSARLIHKMRAEEGKVLRTSMSLEEPDSPSSSDDSLRNNWAAQQKSLEQQQLQPPDPPQVLRPMPLTQPPKPPNAAPFPFQKPPQPLSERPLLPVPGALSSDVSNSHLQVSGRPQLGMSDSFSNQSVSTSRSRDASPAASYGQPSSGNPTPSPYVQNSFNSSNEYFPSSQPPSAAPLDRRQQVPFRPAPQTSTRQVYQQPPPIQTIQPPSRPVFQEHSMQNLPPHPPPHQQLPPPQAPYQSYQQRPNSQQRQAPPSPNLPLRSHANRFAEAVYAVASPTADSARTSNSSLSLPNLTSPLAALSRQQSDAAADSALEDFTERVQHMSGIFRLTAEVMQPMSRYSPRQWLRCCLWWFLRGRAGLETIIRRHKRESKSLKMAMGFGARQEAESGMKLVQPHVDLAKAVWIIQEVFPSLPAFQDYTQNGRMGFTAPTSLASAREAGDAVALQVMEGSDEIRASLKLLLASCAKNDAMPPHASLIQGQDQSIWVQYPAMPPEACAAFQAGPNTSPIDAMPVSDTKGDFVFGRMFVTASISTADDRLDPFPCALIMARQRNTWGLKVGVSTQSEFVSVVIQDEHERTSPGAEPTKPGPGWRDVKWDTDRASLHVNMPPAVLQGQAGPMSMTISFAQPDFMSLINMWNYTRSVAATMHAARDEKMLHEVVTAGLQFSEDLSADINSPQSPSTSFPRERIKRCRVRVFARFEMREESTGHRRIQRGYRVLAVTSPKLKNLSAVSLEVGNGKPIVCELVTDNVNGETRPAVILRLVEQSRQATMSITFLTPAERQQFVDTLTGVAVRRGETVLSHSRFTSLNIEHSGQVESFTQAARDPLRGIRWSDIMVIGEDDSGDQSAVSADQVLSDNLRIVVRAPNLVVTETLSLVQGELKVRMPAAGTSASPSPCLSIFRSADPAPSTTITMLTATPDPRFLEALTPLLQAVATAASVATFHFPTLLDLHNFEAALTAHAVVFDGLSSGFTVSHRRNMVPIYKKQHAKGVRVQVVKRDGETSALLLAFFEQYKLTEAMAFKMLGTDSFEKVDGGADGRAKKKISEKEMGGAVWGVKLIDAKFPMPALRKEGDGDGDAGGGGTKWKHRRTKSKEVNGNGGRDSRNGGHEAGETPRDVEKMADRFVSLDLLEYPGEHDDIVIGFDEESERNSFLDALPAQAQMHRGLTLKRRI